MKVALTSLSIALCQLSLASSPRGGMDLTLDPELYQEALQQVQGGGLVAARRAPQQLTELWEEAMMPANQAAEQPVANPHPRQLARQLRLSFLFKELNPAISFADMQLLLDLHERALRGEMAAQASILQSLSQGMDTQQRRWPHSEEVARRWLKHMADKKTP